jgi:timeless
VKLRFRNRDNNRRNRSTLSEAIRELIRFLRRDDETHEIRRHLGAARILQTDLVPILIQHHEDEEIQDLLLR